MAPRACRRRSCSCLIPACCRDARARASICSRGMAFRRRRSAISSGLPAAIRSRTSRRPRTVARKAELEEYHRLLYVAMTRARDRLYICGWSQKDAPEKASWYELVDQGLQGLLTENAGYDGKPVRRLISEQTVAGEGAVTRPRRRQRRRSCRTGRPSQRRRSARASCSRRRGLARSSATPPSLTPSSRRSDRRRSPTTAASPADGWCTRCCSICRRSQPPSRSARRENFVAARGHDLPEDMRRGDRERDARHRAGPALRAAVRARQPRRGAHRGATRRGRLSGQIDRLAVLDDALLVLDYKTNRPPPQTPDEVAPAYVAQLAAYRAALRLMFPEPGLAGGDRVDRRPETHGNPINLLDLAERRILQKGASLDVPGRAPRFGCRRQDRPLSGVECRRSRRSKRWQLQLFPTTPSRPTY